MTTGQIIGGLLVLAFIAVAAFAWRSRLGWPKASSKKPVPVVTVGPPAPSPAPAPASAVVVTTTSKTGGGTGPSIKAAFSWAVVIVLCLAVFGCGYKIYQWADTPSTTNAPTYSSASPDAPVRRRQLEFPKIELPRIPGLTAPSKAELGPFSISPPVGTWSKWYRIPPNGYRTWTWQSRADGQFLKECGHSEGQPPDAPTSADDLVCESSRYINWVRYKRLSPEDLVIYFEHRKD